mmetsp:Transcript_17399/g.52145  ORF Transcript_17399/g.52145 Transcript_17399/m.52145 type:complete len:290 (-) Transcript_17399:624-1493(-)
MKDPAAPTLHLHKPSSGHHHRPPASIGTSRHPSETGQGGPPPPRQRAGRPLYRSSMPLRPSSLAVRACRSHLTRRAGTHREIRGHSSHAIHTAPPRGGLSKPSRLPARWLASPQTMERDTLLCLVPPPRSDPPSDLGRGLTEEAPRQLSQGCRRSALPRRWRRGHDPPASRRRTPSAARPAPQRLRRVPGAAELVVPRAAAHLRPPAHNHPGPGPGLCRLPRRICKEATHYRPPAAAAALSDPPLTWCSPPTCRVLLRPRLVSQLTQQRCRRLRSDRSGAVLVREAGKL